MFWLHEDVLSVSTVQLGVVFDAGARGAVLFSQKQVKCGENLRFIDLQDGDTAKFHTTVTSLTNLPGVTSPVPFVPATCFLTVCKRVFTAFPILPGDEKQKLSERLLSRLTKHQHAQKNVRNDTSANRIVPVQNTHSLTF